tara:strand:- start:62 stop:277 length:216 start_codon:yes stop_codon:yes gene_type:complete
MNKQRAESAQKTLDYFLTIVPNDDDVETLTADLICNLFHLLDLKGIERELVLGKAEDHYTEETKGNPYQGT